MSGPRRWLTGVAIVLAVLALATPAAAHSSQIGSEPKAGATVPGVPTEVTVEFDTPLLDIGAAMVVRAGDRTVSLDPPNVGRRSISIPIDPAAPAGEYTVAYRVVSEDGHTIESTFSFTVAGASSSPSATAAPDPATASSATSPAPTPATSPADASPTAESPEQQDGPPYLLIAIGILVLVVIVIGALALSR